jgi:hypothetical protein
MNSRFSTNKYFLVRIRSNLNVSGKNSNFREPCFLGGKLLSKSVIFTWICRISQAARIKADLMLHWIVGWKCEQLLEKLKKITSTLKI